MNESLQIIDANFNRLLEALRVVEDILRFNLKEGNLAAKAKRMRHEVGTGFRQIRSKALPHRNTKTDPFARADEKGGRTLYDTLLANFGRAKEAARVLEEVGKTMSQDSVRLKRLRFETYELEKSALLISSRLKIPEPCLYVVLPDIESTARLRRLASECAQAGAHMIQIRLKNRSASDYEKAARRVRRAVPISTLFIVNDNVCVALDCGANGVHLGDDDLEIAPARKYCGFELMIGATTHNVAEFNRKSTHPASYYSVGPMFASMTKPGLQPNGFSYLEKVRESGLPFICIGGINSENVRGLVNRGVRRIAVSSFVSDASSPARAVRELLRAL